MSSKLVELDSQQLRLLHSALSMDLVSSYILPGLRELSSSALISKCFCEYLDSNFGLDVDISDIHDVFVSPLIVFCSFDILQDLASSEYAISIYHYDFSTAFQLYLSRPTT